MTSKSSADYVTGDNWVRNETEIRTFEFVVNGKLPENSLLKVEPLECISGTCTLAAVDEVELEEGQRLWSNAESWESGVVPVEGDTVEILSGVNMLLDIEETPIFASLEINGRLSFLDDDKDIHLRANKIFVRAGEFFIGTATAPFSRNATISLMGDQETETLTLGGTVDGGNKVLGIVGQVEFYGTTRDRMGRLLSEVSAGSTTIQVDASLDWAAGDKIYIAPTTL